MRYVLAFLIALLIGWLIFGVVLLNQASAHTITWPDGETFTFDAACCNAMDCDKLPIEAIREVPGGYAVDYWRVRGNPPRPRHFKGFFPFGDRAIRANPFIDRIMACDSFMPDKEPNTYRPRCIYPIQPTT